MEGVVVVAVIALLSAPVLTLAALAKLGALSRELEEVKRMITVGRGLRPRRNPEETKVSFASDCVSTGEAAAKLSLKSCAPGQRALPKLVETQMKTDVEKSSPVPSPKSFSPAPPSPVPEPVTAADRFWATVEDWFCVRGAFAPKGMSREFAVATRWLLRIGSLLLVGAMAYFITLAINRGWIGPAQRVYGMMFWGVAGTVAGVWLKVKSDRYSILGEVIAALGLVALYLSFGLGHRYFDPPVIASAGFAFAGLVVATVAAGVLSVRLRSLTIAVLGLVGGFLVPTICCFANASDQLAVYLLTLTVGASVVAYLRKWTAFGFAAIVVAYAMIVGMHEWMRSAAIGYAFHLAQYAMVLALTILGLNRRSRNGNAYCWAFVTLSAIAWLVGGGRGLINLPEASLKYHLLFATALHGTLSVVSRRRNWGVAPVMMVLSTLFAALTLAFCCYEWHTWEDVAPLIFCVFAAVLAELAVRTKERTLEVLALLATVSCAVWFMKLAGDHYTMMSDYCSDFVSRALDLWGAPALMVFVGWRLCRKDGWLAELRTTAFVIASVMGFILVTAESKWFGTLVVPTIGGGCITIVWAAIAFGLLTAGIVRRWKAIRLCGLGLLGLSVFKVLFFDTASLATPARVAVFAAVGVLMIVGAFLYLKFRTLFETDPGVPAAKEV